MTRQTAKACIFLALGLSLVGCGNARKSYAEGLQPQAAGCTVPTDVDYSRTSTLSVGCDAEAAGRAAAALLVRDCRLLREAEFLTVEVVTPDGRTSMSGVSSGVRPLEPGDATPCEMIGALSR